MVAVFCIIVVAMGCCCGSNVVEEPLTVWVVQGFYCFMRICAKKRLLTEM